MLDIAIVVFDHVDGADHAYASVLEGSAHAPWMDHVALVEHHRHDRIVVRGTFAGRYVDIDERGEVIGRRTAEGALTGAVVGLFFGPMGLAAGIIGGGAVGGASQAHAQPAVHDALIEEVRADVPERSSGVLLFAAPEQVDAMIAAFADRGTLVRHKLSSEEAVTLEHAVAGKPAVPSDTSAEVS